MATTPTNLPIPSEDPRDLKFNAGKFDEVMTSDAHYYVDRFGVKRWTIAGFKFTAEEAIRNYGYITMDSFEDGATLTLPNQVLRYEATGEYYRWDGEFPKTVAASSTPETTGGVGIGAWLSVGDATLRSDLSSSDINKGSSLVTYHPVASAVISNLSKKLWVDVKSLSDYGFGVPGNTPAQNKAAIIACLNDVVLPVKITIPEGAFVVEPGIPVLSQVVVWEGQGSYASKLFASNGSAPLFNQTAPLVEYSQFRDFGISGNDLVAGINLTNANHCKIERVAVHNTIGSGIIANGYCNDIVGCSIFSNSGNGISLGGVLNNVNVLQNRIYGNGAFAIVTNCEDPLAGLSLNIQFNNIEGNKFGGIRAFNTKGLSIDNNYFERNGETGYTYGDPETLLIRADIHLMSSAGTLIANEALANKNVSIKNNQATPLSFGVSGPNMEGFIFSNYMDGVEVSGNNLLGPDKYNSLIRLYHNRLASKTVSHCKISRNTINEVDFIGSYDEVTQNPDGCHFLEIESISSGQNFIESGMLSWSPVSGSTGTLLKTTNRFNGDYSFAANDGDRVYGTVIDLSIHPELKGKLVWFGAWVNDQNNAAKINVGVNGHYSGDNTPPSVGTGQWRFISTCVRIELTDTAVNCTIYKVGTGSVIINSPMLCIIGTLPSAVGKSYTQQYSTSVPTTGFWDVNEIVLRKPAVSGQPKGWIVTTAGGPGSFNWISLGNL